MTSPPSSIPQLIPQLAAFKPELIIFDKDGTLIDFHTMWGNWITELAQKLAAVVDVPITNQLYKAMGYEADTGRIIPNGELAVTPLAGLRSLTLNVLCTAGLSSQRAEAVMVETWQLPDPVALAQPLTNLKILFSTLRTHGAKIAIATSDDHAPTETMLTALDIAPLVDAVICADDGLPIKPAPDMVLTICTRLNVSCAKTVVIGDNLPDMQMGRAAKAGFIIGVLSGVASAKTLEPFADIILPDIGHLLQP